MKTLSDKETTEDYIVKEEMQKYYYEREDVKEFIKGLKYSLCSCHKGNETCECCRLIEILAGDKLI